MNLSMKTNGEPGRPACGDIPLQGGNGFCLLPGCHRGGRTDIALPAGGEGQSRKKNDIYNSLTF